MLSLYLPVVHAGSTRLVASTARVASRQSRSGASGLGRSRSTCHPRPNAFHRPPYLDQIYFSLSRSVHTRVILLSISSPVEAGATELARREEEEAILALSPFRIARFEAEFTCFCMHFCLIFLQMEWGPKNFAAGKWV
jgi:hypothetical protein